MKRGFKLGFFSLGIVLMMLVFPIMQAQEEAQSEVNPGTTPDSFFWGLDKAFDELGLLFTTGDVDKAKKGLEIAEERLAEIREMIEENELEAAEKAEDAHGKILLKVKEKINEVEDDDEMEEIKEVIEIEQEFRNHNKKVEQASGELKIKIKVEGQITQEQQDLINSILKNLEGQTGEVEIEIKTKKNKIKIKIEQETGKSEQEIEEDIEKLEVEAGVAGVEVEAEIIGSQSEVKIEKEFSTTNTDKNVIIDEIIKEFVLDREVADVALEIETEEKVKGLKEKFKVKVEVEETKTKVEVELKFILDTTDRESILNAVVEKSQLTKEQIEEVIKFEVDDEDEELEIEAEIEKGLAKVKVDLAGEDLEFIIETTDREVVISEIIKRTGLTREQVESVIEFDAVENVEEESADEKEVECVLDSDCKNDKVCKAGKCEKVEEPECTLDADCGGADKICLEGKCEKNEATEGNETPTNQTNNSNSS